MSLVTQSVTRREKELSRTSRKQTPWTVGGRRHALPVDTCTDVGSADAAIVSLVSGWMRPRARGHSEPNPVSPSRVNGRPYVAALNPSLGNPGSRSCGG